MSVLMINGSPHPRGCTFTALSEVATQLKKHGIECSGFEKDPYTGRRTLHFFGPDKVKITVIEDD